MAAQTKPLLHTWSLSLEWQFYFFMPLIVGLVWRLASARLVRDQCGGRLRCRSSPPCHWRGVCGQASKMRRDRPSSPCSARAWEPLAGGLIAAAEIRRRSEGIADPSWLQSPHRCARRLGAGRGLRRLSLARSAMARRAHDSADPGRSHDRRGPTGGRRGQPARIISGPAHRRLVLFDLPVALADLGVRPELAGGARL